MATETTTPVDTETLSETVAIIGGAPATDEPETKDEGGLKMTTKSKEERSSKEDRNAERNTAQAKRVQGKAFNEIQTADDLNLKDYIRGLGAGETLRIDVTRKEPKTWTDPTGKTHSIAGFCGNHNELIDEEQLRELYGGGLFTLRINTPNPATGQMGYFKARDVRISGDPKPVGYNPAPAAAKGDTSETMVKQAFDVLKEQANKGKATGIDPAIQLLLEQQREDSRRRDEQHKREMEQRDQEIRELRAQQREDRERAGKPPEAETFKDKMLSTMMDGETARMAAMRANHESELRQLKEGNTQEIARIHDRHERDVARMEKQHDREVSQLVENHKRELDMLRMSKDSELAAAKISADTQKQIFQAENSRLAKDNDHLRDEVKELRAKKEKSVVEMLKDVDVIKKAIGSDDEKDPETIGEKLVENAPMIIDQIGQAIGKVTGRAQAPAIAAAAAQQAAQQAAQAHPRIIKNDATGETFRLHNGRMFPVKKAGQKVQLAAADGQVNEVEIPQIDPTKIEFAVNYLERAFAGGQDPDTVAISIKPNIPEEILTAISNLGGIDAFMTRVAKLPGSSPLASQAGKNWVRKVGKALVGE